MRRVVAAFDLTPLGRRVAERARMIADQLGAELRLVHVTEPTDESFLERGTSRLLRDHRMREARKVADWIRSRTESSVGLAEPQG
ncbi:MAG: universal stress protein, partial [Acidimicrobiia bacterium]